MLAGSEDLDPSGLIVQFGVPPNRIDLINSIEGVVFDEAWKERHRVLLSLEDGEIPIFYIGLDHLIENKRCVGRPKDLDDLAYLHRARGS